jgi:CspA family cold shock protein
VQQQGWASLETESCPDETPEALMTGKIRTLRVDKGFGFIKDDAGNEYFFHQSAVYGEGIGDLREGDSVEFEVGQGPKGPRAENVRRTST